MVVLLVRNVSIKKQASQEISRMKNMSINQVSDWKDASLTERGIPGLVHLDYL